MPVTTHPAAWHNAIPLAKCTLSCRSPSVTYAARRPAATQATARVVETTRGRKRSTNPDLAEQSHNPELGCVRKRRIEVDIQPRLRRRHKLLVHIVAAYVRTSAVSPEHLVGKRVGCGRHGDVRTRPQRDIHRDQRAAHGIVQRAAQGIDHHIRSATLGPVRPLSSPVTGSSGRADRRTLRIASSASMSAAAAKSPSDFSKSVGEIPYMARTTTAPACAAVMATFASVISTRT